MGVLREVSREGLNRIFISSPSVPFQGHSLLWLVSAGQGVFSHCSWSWLCLSDFTAFLSLELKHNWGLDFFYWMLSPRRKGYPGAEVFVFPVLLPARHLGPSSYGHHLCTWMQIVQPLCSAICLFPYSTCQWIFLASYYPIHMHLQILFSMQIDLCFCFERKSLFSFSARYTQHTYPSTFF